uniref:Apoptosis regulator Bcl-2 family BH4 domain-containing protein n=1 Tax=Bos mutus grunniens TaxID=30521 RepID=A0A8B9X9C2_BOSMU
KFILQGKGYSNRRLVVDFLSYKLSQKGYSWSRFNDVEENRTEASEGTKSDMETPMPSMTTHLATGHSRSLDAWKVIPVTTEKQALREAGNDDQTSQLHITPGTAYQSFEQMMYELLQDGVNWGRIVAFFSFSGALCMESIDKETQVLVSQSTTWMATYLNDHLESWIQENGGWDTSVKLCENNTTTESQKGQERFNSWSLTGMTSAGTALLGLLLNS